MWLPKILNAVARQTQSYKEVNEKKTWKTKERPRPLKTSQSMNTLTEWERHPAIARPRPCPWGLMKQTPHKHTQTDDQPLPPVFLLAVLYANPNSRDGCLGPTTAATLCVNVYAFGVWSALWRLFTGLLQCQFKQWRFPHAGERHTGGHTRHQKVHSMANGMTEGKRFLTDIEAKTDVHTAFLMSDFKEAQCHEEMHWMLTTIVCRSELNYELLLFLLQYFSHFSSNFRTCPDIKLAITISKCT